MRGCERAESLTHWARRDGVKECLSKPAYDSNSRPVGSLTEGQMNKRPVLKSPEGAGRMNPMKMRGEKTGCAARKGGGGCVVRGHLEGPGSQHLLNE